MMSREYGANPARLIAARIGVLVDGYPMTQRMLADKLGISSSAVSAYETGANSIPTKHLDQWAEITGRECNYFFGRGTP